MFNKLAKIIGGLTLAMPSVLGHEEDEIAHMTGMAVSSGFTSGLVSLIAIILVIILAYLLIKKTKNKSSNKLKRRKNG